jgi:lipopolysaccharide export system protein LptA
MIFDRSTLAAATCALLLACGASPSLAQPAAPAADAKARDSKPIPLSGFGGNSKDPIQIDADKLDVFDKEGRAVFSGNVVAVQGDSTMRCSTMTVFYASGRAAGGLTGSRQATPAASTGAQDDGAIRKIDCQGPVTVTSKTQTATGDAAVFDKAANKVILSGNVALSDGPNVTRGERLVYDLTAGVANMETAPGGRVKALFVPGSGSESGQPAAKDGAKPRQ